LQGVGWAWGKWTLQLEQHGENLLGYHLEEAELKTFMNPGS
jgi:hypothetical protein